MGTMIKCSMTSVLIPEYNINGFDANTHDLRELFTVFDLLDTDPDIHIIFYNELFSKALESEGIIQRDSLGYSKGKNYNAFRERVNNGV